MTILATALLWAPTPALAAGGEPRSLNVAGYVEQVQIAGTDIVLDGRLDTGAGLSSLNALDLEVFERDGDDWVRFDIIDPNDEDQRIGLVYPVERTVRILRHSGQHQERYVIKLGLCVADHHRIEEVSLTDRTELTYQLLVGRNHMADALLVDPAERHLQAPECPADVETLAEGGLASAQPDAPDADSQDDANNGGPKDADAEDNAAQEADSDEAES